MTCLALLLAMAVSANAQDSTSVAAPVVLADTTALIAPSVPLSGRPVSGVPIVTPALDVADLLDDEAALATWTYRLGAPGHVAGVSLDALSPARAGATLDGRPLDDVFTGAPRLDLIPWEATDRLVLTGPEAGAPVAVAASLRPFRERVPVTELRFHTGGVGLQNISGTHAQTHGAPLGVGGRRARTTYTFHVGSRQSDGAISGANLRHVHALGRVSLATPRWAAEVTHLYADRSEGARRGVLDNGALFNPRFASILDPGAARTTVRNNLSATLRAPLASHQPTTLWASWTRQLTRYTPGGFSADTVSAKGNRYALGLTQPLGGLAVRAWAALEDDPWGRYDPLGDGHERAQLHAALTDTLRLGRATVAVTAGGHLVDGRLGPALGLRAEAGALVGAVSWTGVVPGRIEADGYFPDATIAPGVPLGTGNDGREQVVAAEIGGRTEVGAVTVTVRPFARLIVDAYPLMERQNVETVAANDVAFGYGRAIEPVGMMGAQTIATWRETPENGLSLASSVTVSTWPIRGPTEIPDRMAEAAPAVFGHVRLGYRARRVGTGTAALDAGATVRGWTAYRGVRVHPATGLLALARTDAPRLPARATLDLDAQVAFGTRARVAVVWSNVLSGLLYDGVRTVQGEPLPARHLRFGVFWAFTE